MTYDEAKLCRFFKDCTYLEEGKKVYKELLFDNHPDKGGDDKACQAIIAQYQAFIRRAIKVMPTATEERKQEDMRNTPGVEMQRILFEVTANINCDVEVIGDWVWCSNVAPLDTIFLSLLGFVYSAKHDRWVHNCGVPAKSSTARHQYTLDDMRTVFGGKNIKSKGLL